MTAAIDDRQVFCAAAYVLVLGGACMAAHPARAAIELEPGLWQDTETGDGGRQAGQAAK